MRSQLGSQLGAAHIFIFPGARSPRMDMERALLAVLLACALASVGSAQPEEPRQGGYNDEAAADQEMRINTAMIALLVSVVAVFVFIVASIIYLRHCTGDSYARSAGPADARGSVQPTGFSSFIARQQQRRAATSRGLAADVVEAFPTMRYVEAKALRVGKKAAPPLECAVCLSEFEDEDMLRLLPKCSHAFHPDCIGEWLVGHVTCPVCRRNLDPSKGAGSDDETSNPNPNPNPPAPLEASSAVARHHQADGVARPSSVVIDVVTEEEAEQRRKEAMELQRIRTQRRAMRSRSRPAGAKPKAKLVRSYSTGHPLAVVRLDRDLERFTLRLPEHLRREMVAAGEQSAHRRGQTTGRWPSLLRYTQTLSGRFFSFSAPRRTDSSEREASWTSSTRIRRNRVAAVDVVDGSAMGGSVAVDTDKAASRQVRP